MSVASRGIEGLLEGLPRLARANGPAERRIGEAAKRLRGRMVSRLLRKI